MPPAEERAAEWLKKAQDDELNAASILRHRDGTPTGVCFMAHQMAEKYLKAYLTACGRKFPKIHQLDRLLALCVSLEKGIETRYPGDAPEFTWRDAEEAFAAASRIKEFVSEQISK